MLVNVETFLLDTLVDTQTVQLFDAKEQSKTTGSSPKVDDEDAKAFSAEESPAVALESTVRGRQQASHQGAKNTTDTMY